MKVGIEIDDREVRELFATLARKGADLAPVMRQIAASLEAATQLRFKDGISPSGAPWLPLSPVTRAVRAKRSRSRGAAAVASALGGAMQPLLDTGRLRGSITSTYSAKQAVVGTNVAYGPIHQFGFRGPQSVKPHTRRSRKGSTHQVRGHTRSMNVPARPYFGLSAADRAEVLEILREHIAAASG